MPSKSCNLVSKHLGVLIFWGRPGIQQGLLCECPTLPVLGILGRGVACVQPSALRKNIEKERLWFTVGNRVQYHVIFSWNVWKMIWLVITLRSLHHWNSEFWLAFISIFPHQHRENQRERFYDEFVCTLCKVKSTNKNLFHGQRGFSFKVRAELVSMEYIKVEINSSYICRNCLCQRWRNESAPDESSRGQYSTIQKIVHSKTFPAIPYQSM